LALANDNPRLALSIKSRAMLADVFDWTFRIV